MKAVLLGGEWPLQQPLNSWRGAIAVFAASVLASVCACSEDETDEKGERSAASRQVGVAVGSLITGTDGSSTGYLKLLKSADQDGGHVELDTARELPGLSDVWVHDGFVFVASGDEPSITKYAVAVDGTLEPKGMVNFEAYGISSAAFWNNTFVNASRAYMSNGPSELIVWNPSSMDIEGTIDIPELEKRGALEPKPSLADRASVVHDGKVYRPIYWTDAEYAGRTPDSLIVVIDGAKNEIIERLKVDCTGLDYGTVGDDGQLYFSNWTGTVGTRLVLDTPPTCYAKIDPATNSVTETKTFADVTGGHEAAAMKAAGGGKFLLSVFDAERANAKDAEDPFEIVGMPNFQLWLYDPQRGSAAPVDGVEWNSGAVYHARVGGVLYSLVPGDDYASTTVYALDGSSAKKVFDIDGWSIRLFGLE